MSHGLIISAKMPVKTAKELSDELTEKLDIEIEKSKVVKA